jgi:hypothetical protein
MALAGTSIAATGATLVPVPSVPGSTSTGVFGINDSETITGSWFDSSGIEHGYYGPLTGSYTTFDYSGNTAKGTEPRAINNNGFITGYGPTDGTGSYVLGPQFEYDTNNGTISTITEAGTPLDGIAQGLNKRGAFGGDHWVVGQTVTRFGYIGDNAQWQQDLSVMGSSNVAARGINKGGVIVGFFVGSDGNDHGFILKNGVVTQVDYPAVNVQDTFLEGINDRGEITGQWYDNSGSDIPFGFLLATKTNKFTAIVIPNSTQQQPWGINNQGLIAVESDVGNYIYCPKKPAKCPGNGIEIPDGASITVAKLGQTLHAGNRVGKAHAGAVIRPGIKQP